MILINCSDYRSQKNTIIYFKEVSTGKTGQQCSKYQRICWTVFQSLLCFNWLILSLYFLTCNIGQIDLPLPILLPQVTPLLPRRVVLPAAVIHWLTSTIQKGQWQITPYDVPSYRAHAFLFPVVWSRTIRYFKYTGLSFQLWFTVKLEILT